MIVTRFAPSPTGYLHVGGARTALFNWLLARREGGKFILRIEDTDVRRNTPTAAEQVLKDLRWLGLEWDEGPDIGGPNGPYLQSQRLEIYEKYANELIEQGRAYYCFDTSEELEQMRNLAETQNRRNSYLRPKRFPGKSDVEKARAGGRPVVVRFAAEQSEPVIVDDILRGQVQFDPAEIGDFIIVKNDGFPTYHFAVVIDDELMGVTHVIRGQEHLMNTPNHQLLQKALGFRIPKYAHMSVTVSETGGKLSKRERPNALRDAITATEGLDKDRLAQAGGISGRELEDFLDGRSAPDMPAMDAMAEFIGVHLPEINIVDFFKSGYLPETLVNFLALLGWNPGDGREIMSVGELTAAFDLSRMNRSNSLFDRKKLLAFNTEHIKNCPPAVLKGHFRRYLDAVGSPIAGADDTMLEYILRINEGARTLGQIEQKSRFAFVPDEAIEYDPEAVKKVLLKSDGLVILRAVSGEIKGLETVSPQAVEQMLRLMAERRGTGLGKVAQPLRVAICGNTISPPIFDAVALLGRERTLKRIERTLNCFGQKPQQQDQTEA